ncbi:MAG: CDP-glucose 4,6-dehydratase [Lachnospiraceae bacterium]|nr:CDP-glucose 4,6-dehydratase [Lachnospiraceae bacterium]
MLDLSFYKGKKVLITGHTGFKGTWLAAILLRAGARVTGYSLEPPTDPSLFALAGMADRMNSVIGDIRDFKKLRETFEEVRPQIVFHLAAQPLVRLSYEEPRMTFETNVMGTVNVLECIREVDSVKSFLNVTTDKVYLNNDEDIAFKEDMMLDGHDPYSNSKSCSELVTHSYVKSFFSEADSPAVSTARAGNVIGGGDFAKDRIIPDCVRAAVSNRELIIRNPKATRPFQHVLEPLWVYLEIAEAQYEKKMYAGYYNVGPDLRDSKSAGDLATMFCDAWGDGMKWIDRSDGGPHEAAFLRLDCAKIKRVFHWKSVWHIERAIEETVAWSKVWMEKGDIYAEMQREIEQYECDVEDAYVQLKG